MFRLALRARVACPIGTSRRAAGSSPHAGYPAEHRECLLSIQLGDRLAAAAVGGGKGHAIADVDVLHHRGVLDLELLGCTTGVGAHRTGLDALKRDSTVQPVDEGDHARGALIGRLGR